MGSARAEPVSRTQPNSAPRLDLRHSITSTINMVSFRWSRNVWATARPHYTGYPPVSRRGPRRDVSCGAPIYSAEYTRSAGGRQAEAHRKTTKKDPVYLVLRGGRSAGGFYRMRVVGRGSGGRYFSEGPPGDGKGCAGIGEVEDGSGSALLDGGWKEGPRRTSSSKPQPAAVKTPPPPSQPLGHQTEARGQGR